MKEADLGHSFADFIDRNTPDYGIMATYPNGQVKIIERFKTNFEAQWWQINVINATASDNEGNTLRSSVIVDLKHERKK